MLTDSIRNAHIEVAQKLILSYKGEEPFSIFLKKYFSSNKKHGSRDRKQIAALCFGYFRLGKGVSNNLSTIEEIELGYLLTHTEHEKDESEESDLNMNLERVADKLDASNIFPFADSLSDEINKQAFNKSFLRQPDLFIRIRPGHERAVVRKLEQHKISFKRRTEHCVALNNATQLKDVLKINKEAVVQDYNSQRISEFFRKVADQIDQPIRIWDCCAASGGKSILAKDYFKNIDLTVSDKRKSILHNLKLRFAVAGIKEYHELIIDLSNPVDSIPGAPFDLIIADVPCSGSGTWVRTPEQLSFFREEQIHAYATLQRSIALNAAKHLKPQGFLLYISCSVFREENEANVQSIINETGLQLVDQQYFKGYEMRADTLFGALMHLL